MASKKIVRWSKEAVIELAKQFATRESFRKEHLGAYKNALANGYADEAFAHMKVLRHRWTYETAMAVASDKKYNSWASFVSQQNGCYLWIQRRGLVDELLGHLPRRKVLYSYEDCEQIVKTVSTRHEFFKKHGAVYKQAYRRGWLEQLFADMPIVSQAGRIKRSSEELFESASKYTSISEWVAACPADYALAIRRGIGDKVCAHMERKIHDNDVVYIWEYVGVKYNGKQVYKIGVTSARLGTTRISICSKKIGAEARLIAFCNVNGKATDIEKKALLLGEAPENFGIDGGSELRALTNEEVRAAVKLITDNVAI